MAAIFTYIPSSGFTKQRQARVLTTQFGEGYQQRMTEGLNNITDRWSLSFTNQPNPLPYFKIKTSKV